MSKRTLFIVLASLLFTACTVGVEQQNATSTERINPALLVLTDAPPTIVLTPPPATPSATAEPAPPTPTLEAEPTRLSDATELNADSSQAQDTTESPQPTATSAAVAPPTVQCSSAFERRELREPYQRDKYTNEARYTLSELELQAYLDVMGVESICVPVELGAPFLNVDWGSAQMPAATGRMLSIGFENLYPGAGWSNGYIVYATFDFALGTEYDTFANLQDRDAVRNHTMPNMIEVDGIPGFVRIQPSAFGFGTLAVYKTYVFPFENYYVAVVYTLGYFDFADGDAILSKLQAGDYPEETKMYVPAIDALATSIQFREQK